MQTVAKFNEKQNDYVLSSKMCDARPYLEVSISEMKMKGLIDSGSSSTLLEQSAWQKIKDLRLTFKKAFTLLKSLLPMNTNGKLMHSSTYHMRLKVE